MATYTVALTKIGKIVDRYIFKINQSYQNAFVDKYVVMPNHVHLLLMITDDNDENGGMSSSRPTLPLIVRAFKRMVSHDVGYSIWQESFYERVLRDEREYRKIWQYIDDNPRRWIEKEKDSTIYD